MNVSIQLPDDIDHRLDALVSRTGQSKPRLIVEAVMAQLEELEDLHLAEQRLIEHRAGRSKTHTLDDVERDLGLAD